MIQRPQNSVNVFDACYLYCNTVHTVAYTVDNIHLHFAAKAYQALLYLFIESLADLILTSFQLFRGFAVDRVKLTNIQIEHCELLTMNPMALLFALDGKLNLSSLLSFFLLILMLLLGTHPNGVYRARGFLFTMQR